MAVPDTCPKCGAPIEHTKSNVYFCTRRADGCTWLEYIPPAKDYTAMDAVGPCPNCKTGMVYEGEHAYACDNPKCCFRIQKRICSAAITRADVDLLLSKKKTQKKVFTWSSGKQGTARLVLNGARLKFQFR